ncbi:MAG: hypothetical protein FRX48_08610 [Lasallia pustulata]|uniref:Uncharacterized protein n=1 Tax=Lasallia pustulata TaxID=136370 RepID=A0A5M8PGD1_9LECA|nr:MAG: hypothetical protein FRX48_08610 [Lasallia pustulata]
MGFGCHCEARPIQRSTTSRPPKIPSSAIIASIQSSVLEDYHKRGPFEALACLERTWTDASDTSSWWLELRHHRLESSPSRPIRPGRRRSRRQHLRRQSHRRKLHPHRAPRQPQHQPLRTPLQRPLPRRRKDLDRRKRPPPHQPRPRHNGAALHRRNIPPLQLSPPHCPPNRRHLHLPHPPLHPQPRTPRHPAPPDPPPPRPRLPQPRHHPHQTHGLLLETAAAGRAPRPRRHQGPLVRVQLAAAHPARRRGLHARSAPRRHRRRRILDERAGGLVGGGDGDGARGRRECGEGGDAEGGARGGVWEGRPRGDAD